ncbi:MAG: PaaI family thioesterase [Gemmatimonadetes bacterium]|uniref:Acyl-coenzyme A thioesterase THEM4 n=1 Tax=Candidatus Kutchimonas denitrificans TaxID=3056748 RepID=A0AAE4ZB77_9BACT|nr:PaaI family thioesterase [Gemmatimonadota bacterium]NIR75982.1 PaaI family thioesterase [Candidatus Kutchimonas denitrificans]NIS02174.1 PaaI family thioesterase [Gemmatimonadota bacterium]NIT68000.1 PaaI family thioesterase [Gemmatimonadota bacterium]NIU54026.1 PaaI family thioesterase [Gemmatimonadota bacterium]
MDTPPAKAFQEFYPDDVAHCYGCGRLNPEGHQLKSYWDDGETVAWFQPQPYHTAIPGYVYGGLIASLIDCHGTGTAAAVAARAEGMELTAETAPPPEAPRFVTASLQVDYLKPTPLGPRLEIRGTVKESSPRKVVVEATLSAEGTVTARGTVVAVRWKGGKQ